MTAFSLRTIVLMLSCCISLVAHAETTGWSWGPFTSSTTKSESGAQAKESTSWLPQWKMPDVTGSVKKATKKVTTTTSNAWDSATRSTKRAWKKTAEVLDPFPDDPKPSSSSYKSSSSQSNWFGGPKKDYKPATVQEFLSQEKP